MPVWCCDRCSTKKEVTMVVGWWVGVVLLWPLVPLVLTLNEVRKLVSVKRKEKRERQEVVAVQQTV